MSIFVFIVVFLAKAAFSKLTCIFPSTIHSNHPRWNSSRTFGTQTVSLYIYIFALILLRIIRVFIFYFILLKLTKTATCAYRYCTSQATTSTATSRPRNDGCPCTRSRPYCWASSPCSPIPTTTRQQTSMQRYTQQFLSLSP